MEKNITKSKRDSLFGVYGRAITPDDLRDHKCLLNRVLLKHYNNGADYVEELKKELMKWKLY